LQKTRHQKKEEKKIQMQCWTTSSAWMWAKGFQSRKTDDEAVGAGPPINFLIAGFKLKAPSLAQQLFLSVFLKPTSLQTVFFFNAENN